MMVAEQPCYVKWLPIIIASTTFCGTNLEHLSNTNYYNKLCPHCSSTFVFKTTERILTVKLTTGCDFEIWKIKFQCLSRNFQAKNQNLKLQVILYTSSEVVVLLSSKVILKLLARV